MDQSIDDRRCAEDCHLNLRTGDPPMSRNPQRFGRTEQDWDELFAQATDFLKEQARLGRLTSYSEVNWAIARRSGLPAFDFELDRDRDAIGKGNILGDISRENLSECGAMLSAIVVYIDRNDAGAGFYKLAQALGLLPAAATADQKLAFWADQVKKVHAHYARPTRQPSNERMARDFRDPGGRRA